MSLTLHAHPLSSFCHKALIAFYENDTPFTQAMVDLMSPEGAAAFKSLWPIARMPLLRDDARDVTLPESSIIIEYLQDYYPGRTRFIPQDPDLARQVRLADRFYDLYVQQSSQKHVFDMLRPEGAKDPHGVSEAGAMLRTALALVERDMSQRIWAVGETFTLADCAAAPALFYADKLIPLAKAHPHAARYLERLMQRPSYARTLKEAEPYFAMYPG
ncbi:MAG TPA: glutathione S-transferase family protein [Parvibaculum sp.]